ncbi:unnamed protein product [Schistosoma turkestanicum]|nr:unnamed protein product [Schistosoma turkestanicum]
MIWRVFAICISVYFVVLRIAEAQEQSTTGNETTYETGGDTTEVQPVLLSQGTHFHEDHGFMNRTADFIDEQFKKEVEELRRLLDELSGRMKELPNSANKYMNSVFLLSICIVSFYVFTFV